MKFINFGDSSPNIFTSYIASYCIANVAPAEDFSMLMNHTMLSLIKNLHNTLESKSGMHFSFFINTMYVKEINSGWLTN